MEKIIVPSHLWIGGSSTVQQEIMAFLQRHFCPDNGCMACTICNAIAQEQYHAIIWIRPEKQYTREILEPVFNQLAFALDTNQQFFFILQDVDFMPSACANSLLKSLEEPPTGYHFFLCAQRMQTILPTIRSRCLMHMLSGDQESQPHPLFDFFTGTIFYDPLTFLKELEQSAINERESIELVDQLFIHWMRLLKKATLSNDTNNYKKTSAILEILAHAFKKLPMPGSSKLFWKDLYLAVKSQH